MSPRRRTIRHTSASIAASTRNSAAVMPIRTREPMRDPASARSQRRTDQQRQRRIDRHGVILLRGREGEEHHHHGDPADCHQARSSGRDCTACTTTVGVASKIHRPGKEPHQVQRPEQQARHGVVVARIAQVEEAQQVFVEEVEPEESAILARARRAWKTQSTADCAGSPAHATAARSPARRQCARKRCSRFHDASENSWRVTPCKPAPQASGTRSRSALSAAGPIPCRRRARSTTCAVRASSGSSRRSHAQIAPVMVSVTIASGIRMRVKRNRPTQVASASPAYRPASSPNAQRPKR